MTPGEQQLVPGITISILGQATVDRSMSDVLFDLALKLEEPTNHPVDVQHVLAAIVLAARNGELDPDIKLSSDDQALVAALIPHVKSVFEKYGGEVGNED